jgi:hypothetical protein
VVVGFTSWKIAGARRTEKAERAEKAETAEKAERAERDAGEWPVALKNG